MRNEKYSGVLEIHDCTTILRADSLLFSQGPVFKQAEDTISAACKCVS